MKKTRIKEVIAFTAAATIITTGIAIAPFVLGKWGNKVDKVIGTESASIQREKFKENKSYVEGMISDLAKYKREYSLATDEEKIGIANFINEEFANFDASLIENESLYEFLYDIRNGEL